MQNRTAKEVFISIVIGACTAFITALMGGVVDWLHGLNPEAVAGTSGGLTYLIQAIRRSI